MPPGAAVMESACERGLYRTTWFDECKMGCHCSVSRSEMSGDTRVDLELGLRSSRSREGGNGNATSARELGEFVVAIHVIVKFREFVVRWLELGFNK